MKNDRLDTVARYHSSAEAELARTLLHAFSVDSVVSIDDCGGMVQERWVAGVKLLVHEAELQKAKEILESAPEPKAGQ